jgi:hypothetical protein
MILLPLDKPRTPAPISLERAHLLLTVKEAISAAERAVSEAEKTDAPMQALDSLHIALSRLNVTAAVLR